MKTSDAVRFFGTKTKVAEVLGISIGAVQQWNHTVPLLSAMRLEELSHGHLKVERDRYDQRGRVIRPSTD